MNDNSGMTCKKFLEIINAIPGYDSTFMYILFSLLSHIAAAPKPVNRMMVMTVAAVVVAVAMAAATGDEINVMEREMRVIKCSMLKSIKQKFYLYYVLMSSNEK